MTQTITNCNRAPITRQYYASHLRTAESIQQLCEFVDAGYPLATREGHTIQVFRRWTPYSFTYDIIPQGHRRSVMLPASQVLEHVLLAPLAYSNDRPLHLEDTITFDGWNAQYAIGIDGEHPVARLLRVLGGGAWRFADETKETK